MTDEEALWPRMVRRQARIIEEAGLVPAVRQTSMFEWEVVVEGKHVQAASFFRLRNGRTKYTGGELLVDGEPQPLAEYISGLRDLWDEHESGITGLIEISSAGNQPVPVPVPVQLVAEILMRRCPRGVRIGRWRDGWAVGVDLQNGDGLRLLFIRVNGGWVLDSDRPAQVIIGGEDKSDDAKGSLHKAIAMLASPGLEGSPDEAPAKTQAGSRANGIETRKMVVIRELGPRLKTADIPIRKMAMKSDHRE